MTISFLATPPTPHPSLPEEVLSENSHLDLFCVGVVESCPGIRANTDIKLGSVSSFKVTMKNKASNGTKVETSQSVAHKDQSVVTALSLKFKKSDGLRLNKIDFDTKGKLAASIAVTNPSPGVDVQLGSE